MNKKPKVNIFIKIVMNDLGVQINCESTFDDDYYV